MSYAAEKFFNGALVSWLKLCVDDPQSLTSYRDLLDGRHLHQVYLKIDPQPFHGDIQDIIDETTPMKNLETVYKNIRHFYEDDFLDRGEVVFLRSPNLAKLGEDPNSAVEEMKLLVTMLLGCAILCPEKNSFIEQIMSGNTCFQTEMVEHIKQITEGHRIVLFRDSVNVMQKDDLFEIIKSLGLERDRFQQEQAPKRETTISPFERSEYGSFAMDRRSLGTPNEFDFSNTSRRSSSLYQASEVTEKQRIEIKKLNQMYLECIEELEDSRRNVEKLREENARLSQEAKLAREYRDQLDEYIEKVASIESVERLNCKLKKQLAENEMYRYKVIELSEDCNMLQSSYDELFEQFSYYKDQAERNSMLTEELERSKLLLENMSFQHTEQERCSSSSSFPNEDELTRISDKLNETIVSEPDLILDVAKAEEPSLFDEMSKQMCGRGSSIGRLFGSTQFEFRQGNSNGSRCGAHLKTIKTLRVRCRRLKNRLKSLKRNSPKLPGKVTLESGMLEKMGQWQSRAILFETRWLAQKCRRSTILEKSKLEDGRMILPAGAFDQEGNFMSYCECRSVGLCDVKNLVVDFVAYNTIGLTAVYIFRKLLCN